MLNLTGTDIVSDDLIFVCLFCGKTSKSKYGFDKVGKNCAQYGWDESCMMNCELFKKDSIVKVRDNIGMLISIQGEAVEYELVR
jgi:hypothetical protein